MVSFVHRKCRAGVSGDEVLEVCTCGSNGCGTKWRTVLEVDCLTYMWSQMAADGGCDRDVVHRMNERLKHGEH